ncbi:SI11A protein, partial [Casuarius casuarius]|nr:SI11A protein [Casuarius casuarius]
VSPGCGLLWDSHSHYTTKMVAFNWKALENFPLLMYILAAKTLILCLAFAGVKMYQSKKIEEKLKRECEEKLKKEAEKKDD